MTCLLVFHLVGRPLCVLDLRSHHQAICAVSSPKFLIHHFSTYSQAMRTLSRSLGLLAVVASMAAARSPLACVPASCCHPTSCVPANEAPDCSADTCDASCQEGTLDCGYGRCVAKGDGSCDVEWTSEPVPPPEEQERRPCNTNDDCVPYPCCQATGCVNPDEAYLCALVDCVAQPGPSFEGCTCHDGFCSLPVPPHHDEPRKCETSKDCVPFPCCLPAGCVSPDEALICNLVDCPPDVPTNYTFEGCSCVDGTCSLPPPKAKPPVPSMGSPCQHHSDCVPNDCCRPNRCVNPEEAEHNCDTVPCYSFAYEEWDVNCWCDVSTWTCGWDIHVYTPTHQCTPRCAPRECCHATECVLAKDAPDCSATLCSAECQEGSLADWCGQAYCRYDEASQSCIVEKPIPLPQPLPPSDPECAGGDCCHSTFCVLATDAPVCDNATCTEECRSGTLDCGYGRCVYDRDSCNCRIEFSAPEPTPPPTSDPRCAGGECCHSTFCVLAGDVPNCDHVPCTDDCQSGTLDCGFGYCVYDEKLNECQIEFVEATPEPPQQCTPRCAPRECCHATECVLAEDAPDCSATLCVAECQEGSLADWCGQAYCRYDEASQSCVVEKLIPLPQPLPPSDPECAGGDCCHSTFCVLATDAPVCDNATCTEECRSGTLDCGYGRCVYDRDSCKCRIEFSAPEPTPPPTSDPRCGGGECCHSTFCVLAADVPLCADFAECPPEDCQPGTLDCGFGYCVYDEELNQCHIEFVEGTPEPTLPPPPPPSDPECTGGQCCHSTFCVLASEPPVCPQDLPCTEECRSGTLDCGYGRCAYDSQSKTCSIQFATVHPDGTIDWINSDPRCGPTQSCHATSCSVISGGTGREQMASSARRGKAAAEEQPCDDSCKPDTLDCGQGRCYFNDYTQTCGVQLFEPQETKPPRTCESDGDCVLDSCCFATECTNIANKPDCSLVRPVNPTAPRASPTPTAAASTACARTPRLSAN
jgi:hypothetical protein